MTGAGPYREHLQRLDPELHDTLEATLSQAARTMTPAGFQHYLQGAGGLADLGRGQDLVVTYLQELPAVARELGDDAVGEAVVAAMRLASMTSGEVISLFFASLPGAAQRLGDLDLFRGYLDLIHQLAARAPRGLRPMLGVVDELLCSLTLGGLRRWAFFGAQAHRGHVAAQLAYFALSTPDSRAVLAAEHRGTLFVDHQRKLSAYLRALWGRDFWLRPADGDRSEFTPYADGSALHLPDAVEDAAGLGGLDVYRAIAAHLAAHVVHAVEPVPRKGLTPAQANLVGLFEDARVEHAATAELPGLVRLWRPLLGERPRRPAEFPARDGLERLTLQLLDASATTGDAELDAVGRRFHAGVGRGPHDASFALELGLDLAAILAARRAEPSLRQLEGLRPLYRDDNRYVFRTTPDAWPVSGPPAGPGQVRRHVGVLELVNEVEVETAGEDAQEVWHLDGALFDDDGVTFNAKYAREPVAEPVHYPEWDYQAHGYRPHWATLQERRAPTGDPAVIDEIVRRHAAVARRLRKVVERLRPQGVVRERKLEDGDELDLGAAVDAMVDLRAGRDHDPRVTLRLVRKRRDLAVLVLLDLSESTNDPVRGGEDTVLGLTREAAALVAGAAEALGDACAVHGFCSDGRHDVRYYRLKDFQTGLDDVAKARLAGMGAGLSTRMGAALRHAGQLLRRQPQRRKLLLVITDGEPADVDQRDPQYLRHDARKAVEELRATGVFTYCLTLDPEADRYVQRIFGDNRYTILDRVERLPSRLPELFAGLTG